MQACVDVHTTGQPILSATSRNLVTASQSIQLFTHKRTALLCPKPRHEPAFIFPLWNERQASPHVSLLSHTLPLLRLTPSISLQPAALHSLRHSQNISQQLLPSCCCCFFLIESGPAILQLNPTMRLFLACYKVAARQPLAAHLWHTCHEQRRPSGTPLCPFTVAF